VHRSRCHIRLSTCRASSPRWLTSACSRHGAARCCHPVRYHSACGTARLKRNAIGRHEQGPYSTREEAPELRPRSAKRLRRECEVVASGRSGVTPSVFGVPWKEAERGHTFVSFSGTSAPSRICYRFAFETMSSRPQNLTKHSAASLSNPAVRSVTSFEDNSDRIDLVASSDRCSWSKEGQAFAFCKFPTPLATETYSLRKSTPVWGHDY
jgi:hypothetical protein